MSVPNAPDYLVADTPQGRSGNLQHTGSQPAYLFTCAPDAPAEADVSLTMPRRRIPYEYQELHPIFQMNLPEGYVLEQLKMRFAKAARLDPMMLLAMTGKDAAIGRVRLSSPATPSHAGGVGERLDEILSWDGTEDLFAELADRYLLRSGVSGVQPKLLVPEAGATDGKATVTTSELIVKSSGQDFPGLAINEFVCMSIAKETGLPIPEFHLSENRKLFVLRRFDRTTTGDAIGFEDMAVLMGKGSEQKYSGSYEHIAKAVMAFCSPENRQSGLSQLFDQVALSCLVGNGDAHLKNFGVTYGQPHDERIRLAPVYDVVNTTAYFNEDTLALTLGGNKSFFAARLTLLDFAKVCGVDHDKQVTRIMEAAHRVLAREAEKLEDAPEVARAIAYSLSLFG